MGRKDDKWTVKSGMCSVVDDLTDSIREGLHLVGDTVGDVLESVAPTGCDGRSVRKSRQTHDFRHSGAYGSSRRGESRHERKPDHESDCEDGSRIARLYTSRNRWAHLGTACSASADSRVPFANYLLQTTDPQTWRFSDFTSNDAEVEKECISHWVLGERYCTRSRVTLGFEDSSGYSKKAYVSLCTRVSIVQRL